MSKTTLTRERSKRVKELEDKAEIAKLEKKLVDGTLAITDGDPDRSFEDESWSPSHAMAETSGIMLATFGQIELSMTSGLLSPDAGAGPDQERQSSQLGSVLAAMGSAAQEAEAERQKKEEEAMLQRTRTVMLDFERHRTDMSGSQLGKAMRKATPQEIAERAISKVATMTQVLGLDKVEPELKNLRRPPPREPLKLKDELKKRLQPLDLKPSEYFKSNLDRMNTILDDLTVDMSMLPDMDALDEEERQLYEMAKENAKMQSALMRKCNCGQRLDKTLEDAEQVGKVEGRSEATMGFAKMCVGAVTMIKAMESQLESLEGHVRELTATNNTLEGQIGEVQQHMDEMKEQMANAAKNGGDTGAVTAAALDFFDKEHRFLSAMKRNFKARAKDKLPNAESVVQKEFRNDATMPKHQKSMNAKWVKRVLRRTERIKSLRDQNAKLEARAMSLLDRPPPPVKENCGVQTLEEDEVEGSVAYERKMALERRLRRRGAVAKDTPVSRMCPVIAGHFDIAAEFDRAGIRSALTEAVPPAFIDALENVVASAKEALVNFDQSRVDFVEAMFPHLDAVAKPIAMEGVRAEQSALETAAAKSFSNIRLSLHSCRDVMIEAVDDVKDGVRRDMPAIAVDSSPMSRWGIGRHIDGDYDTDGESSGSEMNSARLSRQASNSPWNDTLGKVKTSHLGKLFGSPSDIQLSKRSARKGKSKRSMRVRTGPQKLIEEDPVKAELSVRSVEAAVRNLIEWVNERYDRDVPEPVELLQGTDRVTDAGRRLAVAHVILQDCCPPLVESADVEIQAGPERKECEIMTDLVEPEVRVEYKVPEGLFAQEQFEELGTSVNIVGETIGAMCRSVRDTFRIPLPGDVVTDLYKHEMKLFTNPFQMSSEVVTFNGWVRATFEAIESYRENKKGRKSPLETSLNALPTGTRGSLALDDQERLCFRCGNLIANPMGGSISQDPEAELSPLAGAVPKQTGDSSSPTPLATLGSQLSGSFTAGDDTTSPGRKSLTANVRLVDSLREEPLSTPGRSTPGRTTPSGSIVAAVQRKISNAGSRRPSTVAVPAAMQSGSPLTRAPTQTKAALVRAAQTLARTLRDSLFHLSKRVVSQAPLTLPMPLSVINECVSLEANIVQPTDSMDEVVDFVERTARWADMAKQVLAPSRKIHQPEEVGAPGDSTPGGSTRPTPKGSRRSTAVSVDVTPQRSRTNSIASAMTPSRKTSAVTSPLEDGQPFSSGTDIDDDTIAALTSLYGEDVAKRAAGDAKHRRMTAAQPTLLLEEDTGTSAIPAISSPGSVQGGGDGIRSGTDSSNTLSLGDSHLGNTELPPPAAARAAGHTSSAKADRSFTPVWHAVQGMAKLMIDHFALDRHASLPRATFDALSARGAAETTADGMVETVRSICEAASLVIADADVARRRLASLGMYDPAAIRGLEDALCAEMEILRRENVDLLGMLAAAEEHAGQMMVGGYPLPPTVGGAPPAGFEPPKKSPRGARRATIAMPGAEAHPTKEPAFPEATAVAPRLAEASESLVPRPAETADPPVIEAPPVLATSGSGGGLGPRRGSIQLSTAAALTANRQQVPLSPSDANEFVGTDAPVRPPTTASIVPDAQGGADAERPRLLSVDSALPTPTAGSGSGTPLPTRSPLRSVFSSRSPSILSNSDVAGTPVRRSNSSTLQPQAQGVTSPLAASNSSDRPRQSTPDEANIPSFVPSSNRGSTVSGLGDSNRPQTVVAPAAVMKDAEAMVPLTPEAAASVAGDVLRPAVYDLHRTLIEATQWIYKRMRLRDAQNEGGQLHDPFEEELSDLTDSLEGPEVMDVLAADQAILRSIRDVLATDAKFASKKVALTFERIKSTVRHERIKKERVKRIDQLQGMLDSQEATFLERQEILEAQRAAAAAEKRERVVAAQQEAWRGFTTKPAVEEALIKAVANRTPKPLARASLFPAFGQDTAAAAHPGPTIIDGVEVPAYARLDGSTPVTVEQRFKNAFMTRVADWLHRREVLWAKHGALRDKIREARLKLVRQYPFATALPAQDHGMRDGSGMLQETVVETRSRTGTPATAVGGKRTTKPKPGAKTSVVDPRTKTQSPAPGKRAGAHQTNRRNAPAIAASRAIVRAMTPTVEPATRTLEFDGRRRHPSLTQAPLTPASSLSPHHTAVVSTHMRSLENVMQSSGSPPSIPAPAWQRMHDESSSPPPPPLPPDLSDSNTPLQPARRSTEPALRKQLPPLGRRV